jgi:hypothetical protein
VSPSRAAVDLRAVYRSRSVSPEKGLPSAGATPPSHRAPRRAFGGAGGERCGVSVARVTASPLMHDVLGGWGAPQRAACPLRSWARHPCGYCSRSWSWAGTTAAVKPCLHTQWRSATPRCASQLGELSGADQSVLQHRGGCIPSSSSAGKNAVAGSIPRVASSALAASSLSCRASEPRRTGQRGQAEPGDGGGGGGEYAPASLPVVGCGALDVELPRFSG